MFSLNYRYGGRGGGCLQTRATCLTLHFDALSTAVLFRLLDAYAEHHTRKE